MIDISAGSMWTIALVIGVIGVGLVLEKKTTGKGRQGGGSASYSSTVEEEVEE